MIILKNSFVQRRIWKSEALVETVVRDWFPKLPDVESKEVTNWLPCLNLPPLVFQNNRPPHETLKLQTTIASRSDQYEALFKGFGRAYSFVGSRELQDRITYFTTAWIMTLLEAPVYPEVKETNPSALAIRGFRLHSKFLEEWPARKRNANYRFIFPFHLFRASAPSPADLKTLLNVLFDKQSPATNPSAQLVAMKALGYVRNSRKFKEAIAPSVKILEDSDFSSWHRHGLTPGLISKLRPDAAKSIIGELTKLVEELTKRQEEEVRSNNVLSARPRSNICYLRERPRKRLPRLLHPYQKERRRQKSSRSSRLPPSRWRSSSRGLHSNTAPSIFIPL